MAVLFPGTKLCSAAEDGTLTMVLARGGEPFGLSPTPIQRFRYALLPFEDDWRGADVTGGATAFSEQFHVTTVEARPGRLPGRHGFVEVDRPGFIVSAVKVPGYPHAAMEFPAASEHPRNGFVVRGWQSTGETWYGNLRFFASLLKAAHSDRRELPGEALAASGSDLACRLPGFGVTSLWVLTSGRFAPGDPSVLARTADPHGPVYTRHWLHNAGTAPIGNHPISLLMQGNLTEENPKVEVIVANNTVDRTLEGVVHVETSQDWSIGPSQFAYHIKPNTFFQKEINIIAATGVGEASAIAVWTSVDGQVYRDVLMPTEAPFAMQVSRNESQVKVSVVNRSGIAAEGFLDLIAPSEFWPEIGVIPEISIFPRRAAVSVPPFGSQDILFRFSDPKATTWAVAKLATNGRVLYEVVPLPAGEK